ncbi:peptidoglycan-binding domain-containing protein [Thalassovita aquimarina]|uniref:Peptidoglycan-binding protein n=1 Tax=Thalassovita aquimarina TaxID=2785917 RepID=A0ABS5HTW4_9RHOB|nr:peptidoglycan-binding domain-containing protein [Thalassovita aquimarina]MBR9652334.1 peptidoglycan-binding protein [Thalassovita aquimarina]
MRISSVFTGLVAAMLLWTHDARAADYALILTNRSYDNAPAEPRAASFDTWSSILREAGFEVFGGQDWKATTMTRAAESFRSALAKGDADRIVVIASGRIVASSTDSWLLGRDYRDLSDMTVGRYGVSLGGLAQILGGHPGHGVLVVAPSWSSREAPGPGLRVGARRLPLAQGVALLEGPADKLQPLLGNAVMAAPQPLGRIARNLPKGVTMRGYLPDDLPLGLGDGDVDPVNESDAAYWSAVRDLGTVAAYRSYLDRFPNGLFAGEARRLIAEAEDEPRLRAEAEEKALGLSWDDRRNLQRDLTLLGFDTGGVDGVFGANSRSAIRRYQKSRNYTQTGYLTAQQVGQIRREASQRREELERQDRAYWQRSGALGTEAGYRDYLNRYPNGIYAETARDRLAEIERSRGEPAAWDRARRADTIAAYRNYLDTYPFGAHARDARDRIAELERDRVDREQIERDKAEERTVAANPISRLLVEQSLKRVGLNPGKIDGNFDKQTRKALRQFQRANELPATGYVSQRTMVLLTTGILR